MPIAVQADWELIREFYRNGLSCTEIAAKTGVQSGTIASRASRGAWKAVAARAKEQLQKPTVSVEIDSPAEGESKLLTQASTKARSSLSDELLRCADTLAKTKPGKAIRAQSERATVLSTITSVAKTVYGWSEGQSQPAVRINLLGTAIISQAPSPTPVIEVESTPVIEQEHSRNPLPPPPNPTH